MRTCPFGNKMNTIHLIKVADNGTLVLTEWASMYGYQGFQTDFMNLLGVFKKSSMFNFQTPRSLQNFTSVHKELLGGNWKTAISVRFDEARGGVHQVG